MSWERDAACKGRPIGLFYPDGQIKGRRALVRSTIATHCLPCPVRAECLAEELARPPRNRRGVRGGVHFADGGGSTTRRTYDPHGCLTTPTEG